MVVKFRMYYAAAIDVCVKEAFEQIDRFKTIFSKYNIDVYGAGFGESPIIGPASSREYKAVVTSYDFRKIRECDILLVVTNLETFCAGTFIEMDFAKRMGLYIVVFSINGEKPKNIFIESLADKIIYSFDELKDLLQKITNQKI